MPQPSSSPTAPTKSATDLAVTLDVEPRKPRLAASNYRSRRRRTRRATGPDGCLDVDATVRRLRSVTAEVATLADLPKGGP